MNDFDDIISGAVAGRAEHAPTNVPDFGDILATRQERLRRRTVLAAGGLVVAGLAGIGLFASAADESPGVAGEPSTTPPRFDEAPQTTGPSGDSGIWYCVGRVTFTTTPTTTVAGTGRDTRPNEPTTTTSTVPLDSAGEPVTPTTLLNESDSGYYEHCRLVGADEFSTPAPTTTVTVVEGTAPPMTTTIVASLSPEEAARLEAEAEARRAAAQEEARRLAEEGTAPPTTGGG